MATSISSKYDYIPFKRLIHSGSPAVYQLLPKKKDIGTIKKLTLGERDPNKTNRTILLVGETGSGKSTLINALVNHAIGVKWEDDVWFEIVDEKEKKDQCESQTSDVIVYEIFGFEGKTLPYSLTIIDTPGYGDTRGAEEDDKISRRMLDVFRSKGGVHEINVIGLVMKSTENRLSDRLMYIFDSVVSLFGKDMENNIIFLITHSDGRVPKNALKAIEAAKITCAQNEKNQPVHFLFNNCQKDDRTEEEDALKHADQETSKGMIKFSNFLQKAAPQNLEKTMEVLNSHIRLKACIQNLQERVELIELKQVEIQQTRDALKKHEEQMNSNENFTVEVDEVYKVKEPIDGGMWWLVFYGGVVCCKVCEENCHPGCTMAWCPSHCEVMSGGCCTVCTKKCPASVHVKEQKKYVTKTRRVQKTLQDVKEKYEKKKADCEKTTDLLADLEKHMEELQMDKDQWLEEAFQHILKLEQDALNVDSLSTLVHLDFLIQKMNERGAPEKVQKLEEMKRRVDEGKRAGMGYMFGRMMAAGKSLLGLKQ